MAFANLTLDAGSAANKTAGGSLALTPTVQCNAEDVVTAFLVTDNRAEASGNTNLHTSITDPQGNTWTKVFEQTRSAAGVAADGVTGSIWISKLAANITTAQSITFNLAVATITSKTAHLARFSIGAGNVPAVAGAQGAHGNVAAQTVTLGSLTSLPYLWLGLCGVEDELTTITKDADYTVLAGAASSTAGANDTNVVRHSHFRLFTGTTDTYANSTIAVDNMTILAAIREDTPAPTFAPSFHGHRVRRYAGRYRR